MSTPGLSAGEFQALYQRCKRMARWGPDDRKGALNNISHVEIVAAASDVWRGRTVSLAAPLESRVTPDNPEPYLHRMTNPSATTDQPDGPGAVGGPGLSFAMDRIAMNIHGNADSHIDALCHVLFDGVLYNDVPAETVTMSGATELSIDVAGDGIVGRGLLLDIPRARGVRWLEPGDHVTADDLAAAETVQDVHIGQGDLLFVRVGHRRRRHELGAWDASLARAGLHPTALEFLAERRIGALGSDGNNDTAASAVEGVDFPVHVLAINAMGLHLLDYLHLEDLLNVCEHLHRWSFLCVIAPLRLPAGTGSPINPIAIF
jgi:kynurenine formamidase